MTRPIGETLLEFDKLDSTNKEAAELLALSKVDHGAVILAHSQADGRGQRGSAWLSSPGQDLTFSIVVKPPRLRADAQFALGKIAALAVHDTVRKHVEGDVRIKWPNDVLVERKKIAGILIKNEVVGELVMSAVIGIGLNVNNTSLPEELVATSLAKEAGKSFDRKVVLRECLDRFGHWWGKWTSAPGEGLVSYTDRLWTRGRWTDMTLDGAPIRARTVDVDPLGRLIIETEDGAVNAYGLDRLRFAPR
ncbi:MAG: biotin--[acetyl-CoA-carboxylase] ligase [Flavobacteriales bacterium]|nr:biotin--[acetyl-CoA-carboxylase] ligase [Flavobacteriales bacterium]MCC6939429.1 biotin--[acetyl-CoA-carboxylase] ligase [Flavobacteriales bacterium]